MNKFKLGIILSFMLIGAINAQWIGTTIYIPDSLCGIVCPRAFTYNPTNNV